MERRDAAKPSTNKIGEGNKGVQGHNFYTWEKGRKSDVAGRIEGGFKELFNAQEREPR